MSEKENPFLGLLKPALMFAEDIQAEDIKTDGDSILVCKRCDRPRPVMYVSLMILNEYSLICLLCLGVEMIINNEEIPVFKSGFAAIRKEGKPWIAKYLKKIRNQKKIENE